MWMGWRIRKSNCSSARYIDTVKSCGKIYFQCVWLPFGIGSRLPGPKIIILKIKTAIRPSACVWRCACKHKTIALLCRVSRLELTFSPARCELRGWQGVGILGRKDGGVFAVCLSRRACWWEDVFSPNEVTTRNVKTINNQKLRNHTLCQQCCWKILRRVGMDRFVISLCMPILYIFTRRIHR